MIKMSKVEYCNPLGGFVPGSRHIFWVGVGGGGGGLARVGGLFYKTRVSILEQPEANNSVYFTQRIRVKRGLTTIKF